MTMAMTTTTRIQSNSHFDTDRLHILNKHQTPNNNNRLAILAII